MRAAGFRRMTRIGLIFTAVLLAAVALVGCGGSDSEDTATVYSTADVIEAFEQETGERLIDVEDDPTSSWDRLEVDGDTDRRWGFWNLYVVTDGGTSVLLDDNEGRAMEADGDGIYWQKQGEGSNAYWTATKRYGDNVVVQYTGQESRDETLSPQYERLDAALQSSLN